MNNMLRSHVHDLLSDRVTDHPPFVVELSERMADMLCIYVFDNFRQTLSCAKHEGVKRKNKEEFSVPLGWTNFTFEENAMMIRRERFGQPCGLHGEPRQYEIVLVYGPSMDIIERLLTFVREQNKAHEEESKFLIFKWSAKHGEWFDDSFAEKRTIESVILDKGVHDQLISDIQEFTDESTIEWYRKHHIPYRRGYMFYGPPGTGKTSTITAITSYLKRNLYRINLVAPGLCDDSLMSAMQQVPRESVIMFEDIDSLFGIHREKNETFSVTFSGLLNSIDGICDSTRGLIFMFTTNHLDKVDNALKRCGRIDRIFYLGHCCTQQMVDMFLRFYPSENEHAKLFAKNCMSKAKHMTPAEAQHHFIMHRKSDSLKAATEIIIERKNDSNSEAMYS